MACNDIVSAILHYKRNIDKISDPPERALKYEDRLLHCINKLYKLPVNVNHLQETGVGRTVNSLRKIEGEKGLGDAAKALVAKWKTMVILEDEAERKQREEECSGPSEDDINRIKLIRESEKSEQKKTDNSSMKASESPCLDNQKSRNHESTKKHRDDAFDNNKSNRKRKFESDENEKHQSKRRELHDENDSSNYAKQSSDRLDHKDIKTKSKTTSSGNSSSSSNSNKDSNKSQHKSLSSSKNYESSPSSSSSSTSKSKEDRKKSKDDRGERKSSSSKSSFDNSSSKHHSSSHKHESKSKKKSKEYTENDGFDSQSGASFADALGPIVVKKSHKKRSGHNSSTVSSPAPSEHSGDSGVSNVKEKVKDAKEMLFSQPKLEPLEPDLVATLPTPTPYYKPHPSYIPSQEAVRRRVQAEEDALTTIMSNKNTRTKVYSGVKGGLSYVPSLYECCCRVLQQHIDALEYTGGIPYSLLKPVLEGATPSQLYQFEHFNPYIIEETDDLWKFHVNKEFRSEKRQEFESWRDMYLRCVDEREEKYKAVTANIIQRTIENSVPVRKAKLAYIDVAKPPRNILKKQIKNGTAKPDSARLLGKNDPEAVRVSAPKQPITKEPSSFRVKPKVAPLMQKTLKSIKMSRFKR